MIKNIDSATIISVSVLPEEKDIIKDGDVLVYDGIKFELTKSDNLTEMGVFGVVVDDNVGSETRWICVGGICEVNIADEGYPFWFVFFNPKIDRAMTFNGQDGIFPAGFMIKKLPNKYGRQRALVNIFNSSNYLLT